VEETGWACAPHAASRGRGSVELEAVEWRRQARRVLHTRPGEDEELLNPELDEAVEWRRC